MGFQNNKSFNYLLIGLNTLFMIYYVMLAIHNRFHYDDLHFLWKLREVSIFEYVSDMYYFRSGRFVAYAINGIIFTIINFIQIQWFFPVFFWLIGVLMSVFSILKLTNQPFTFGRINAIILIYNVFVLTNIDFAVFNWLCALSYYILAPAMLTLIALLVSDKAGFKTFSAIIFLSVFLGGGQEAFTPIVLALTSAIVMYEFYRNKFKLSPTIHSLLTQKTILSIGIMVAMLLIVVMAPGNYKRLEMEEFTRPDSLFDFLVGIVNAVSMFYYYLLFYIPYFLILALVVYRCFAVNLEITTANSKKYVIVGVIVYSSYVILSVFPSVFLWGGFGIQRNYTHLVYVSILFFIGSFFWVCINFFKHFIKHIHNLATIGVVILGCIMLFNLLYDYQSASRYADAVDQRIATALRHNESKTTENLIVKALPVPHTLDPKYIFFKLIGRKSNPQPVLFYMSDTDTIANEYASHFRRYYQLNFDIVLENE